MHIMFHLILRACFLGNPWAYHTFWDESLNKQLKQVCRLCHQANFDAVAIIKGTEVLKRVASKRPLRWKKAHACLQNKIDFPINYRPILPPSTIGQFIPTILGVHRHTFRKPEARASFGHRQQRHEAKIQDTKVSWGTPGHKGRFSRTNCRT